MWLTVFPVFHCVVLIVTVFGLFLFSCEHGQLVVFESTAALQTFMSLVLCFTVAYAKQAIINLYSFNKRCLFFILHLPLAVFMGLERVIPIDFTDG